MLIRIETSGAKLVTVRTYRLATALRAGLAALDSILSRWM